jgi:16S rRNA processing protein RimM
MPEYIHIGKLAASFGLKGELVLVHSLGKKSTFKDLKALFVEELKGSYIPYFLESAKAQTDTESTVKLEGINSKESAHRLQGKPVWLLEADFRRLAGSGAPIALIGFTVITDEEEVLGPVEEVIEQPHQILLRINWEGREALIPLHAETLDAIDQQARTIHVVLPDGLLDIYR